MHRCAVAYIQATTTHRQQHVMTTCKEPCIPESGGVRRSWVHIHLACSILLVTGFARRMLDTVCLLHARWVVITVFVAPVLAGIKGPFADVVEL